MSKVNFENDLSKGNVASQLLRFAMPFIISNIIQSLYNVVDLVVVGWFGNDASVSAVNNGSQLTFFGNMPCDRYIGWRNGAYRTVSRRGRS